MPHASVKITGGIVVTETPALNEAGISNCQLIRLKPDPRGLTLPEKIGGWAKYYNIPMPAVVRTLKAWEDTNANKWLAAGTNNDGNGVAHLIVMNGVTNSQGITQATAASDITPQYTSDAVATNFATTAGSSTVTITDATTQGITAFDAVYIVTPVSVGGFVLQGL